MIERFFLVPRLVVQLLLTLSILYGTQVAYASEFRCNASGSIKWATLEYVIDGDTLRLESGEKVRAIAINTPELGKEHRPAEPFAIQARKAVIEFFRGSNKIGLSAGIEPNDRYGRSLAHIYRADGASLAQYLLGQGLAYHITVPPNNTNWECLAEVESDARNKSLGLWQHSSNQIKHAANLKATDSGFQIVEGIVDSVSRSKNSSWITLGKLAVRIRDKDLKYFKGFDIARWQGTRVRIRGWLIDRSQSKSIKKNNFQPFMMNLRHRAMIK